eukprot:evm.model.NODE_18374_length_10441_cov_20.629154.5
MIRIKKELQQSELPPNCIVQLWGGEAFSSPTSNLFHLRVSMLGPPGSFFEDETLHFELDIPLAYPFKPPRVTCHSRCWHPNICPNSGLVALSILGEDWRPTLSLSTLIYGVQLALVEPNLDLDVTVNMTAADTYTHDPERFHGQVQDVLNGYGAWGPGNSSNSSTSSSRGDSSGRGGGRGGIRPMMQACGAVTGGGGLISPRGRGMVAEQNRSNISSSSSSSSSSGNDECGLARKRKLLHQMEPPERGLEAMCIDDSSKITSSSSTNTSTLLDLSLNDGEGKSLPSPGSGQHIKRARSVGGGERGGEGGDGVDLAMVAAAAAAATRGQQRSVSFPFSMMMANEDGGVVKAPPPAS